MSTQDITFAKIGRCAVITLDRPKALNALTLPMVAALAKMLDAYAADADIGCVVIKSSSSRAFCAGADIRRLYELGRVGKHEEQMAFFREEYRLCRKIARYPKPYVALIDGVTLGGGAGISLHGSHRIAGEALSFAMPEVGIGFFPDVGASYFLSRLPGCFGSYLALTGSRIAIGDVLGLGLATAHVPAARFEALLSRLCEGQDVDQAIAAERAPSPEALLVQQRHLIDGCFAAKSISTILKKIDEASYAGSGFAMATYEMITSRSPMSLVIALRLQHLGLQLDLEAALQLEYRVADRIVRGHDYYEGVRAVIIDKDGKPHWVPAGIGEVKLAEIEGYFAPLPESELEFPALAGTA